MSGQRLRLRRAGPRRRAGAPPAATCTSASPWPRTRGSSVRATTSSPCSTCRSPGPRSGRRRRSRPSTAATSSRSGRARSPARLWCCAGKGIPVLGGRGRGDHRIVVERARAAQAHRTSSAALLDAVRGRRRRCHLRARTTASSAGCAPRSGEALPAAGAGRRGRARPGADARALPGRRRGGARRRRRRPGGLRRRAAGARTSSPERGRARLGGPRGASTTARSLSGRLWIGPPWFEPEDDRGRDRPGAGVRDRCARLDPGGARAAAAARAAARRSTSAAARACSRSRLPSSGSGRSDAFDRRPAGGRRDRRERRAKRRRARGGPGRRSRRPTAVRAALAREPRAGLLRSAAVPARPAAADPGLGPARRADARRRRAGRWSTAGRRSCVTP